MKPAFDRRRKYELKTEVAIKFAAYHQTNARQSNAFASRATREKQAIRLVSGRSLTDISLRENVRRRSARIDSFKPVAGAGGVRVPV